MQTVLQCSLAPPCAQPCHFLLQSECKHDKSQHRKHDDMNSAQSSTLRCVEELIAFAANDRYQWELGRRMKIQSGCSTFYII